MANIKNKTKIQCYRFIAAICLIAMVMLIRMVIFNFITLNETITILKTQQQVMDVMIKNTKEELDTQKEKIDTYEEVFELIESRSRSDGQLTSRGYRNTGLRQIKEVLFEVTMYTNAGGAWKVGSPYWGTMANGEKTHIGVVATPVEIPFGSQIIFKDIPDEWDWYLNKVFVAKDRGSAIVKKSVDGKEIYCVDVYTEDKNLAKEWGRRIISGYIIEYH